MFLGYKVLSSTRLIPTARIVRHLSHASRASIFNAKPVLSTQFSVSTRPQYTKLAPLFLGGIRQHGSHGHHHHDADLINSLKSSSKRGTRITVIGLASNVGLTITKGVAGWYVNFFKKKTVLS